MRHALEPVLPGAVVETVLRYRAKAEVGGQITQLGSRLIQGTAKKLKASFFTKFAAEVNETAVG